MLGIWVCCWSFYQSCLWHMFLRHSTGNLRPCLEEQLGHLKSGRLNLIFILNTGTWLMYGCRKVFQGVICRNAKQIAHFLFKILLFPSLCIEVLKGYLLSFVTVYNNFGIKVDCILNLIDLLLWCVHMHLHSDSVRVDVVVLEGEKSLM